MRKSLPLLEGWRFEQFGRDALQLVEGKLAFAVLGGKLRMTHIDEIHSQMDAQSAAEALAANDEPGDEADEPSEDGDFVPPEEDQAAE